ncbi:MAG TPA: hypothetical protein VJ890_21655 [Vineibacter sp.]|nr:hypothetical protein [Vineibacter sp.]
MVIMKRHQPALAKELQPMPSINVARKVEPPQAPTDIMDVVAAIAARDSVSKFQAMSLAAVERPDLLAKFQAAPLPPLAKAAPMPPAVAGFNKRIDEIRRRDGCSRIEAMEKARVEHADEFAAYRVA